MRSQSTLIEVTPPTGEPYAGEPHVRFGGRETGKSTGLSYPYRQLFLERSLEIPDLRGAVKSG
jgi:hypothetical protein